MINEKLNQISKEALKCGYEVCECGKYVFVFSTNVKIKPGHKAFHYCKECGLEMTPIESIEEVKNG